MKIYKSYKELKGNTLKHGDELHFKVKEELKGMTLEFGDRIHFKVKRIVLEYKTMSSWLSGIDCFSDAIFNTLNIKNKHKFCSESYGYDTDIYGIFPSCHENDYKALTRVALDLFKLCDNYEGDKK